MPAQRASAEAALSDLAPASATAGIRMADVTAGLAEPLQLQPDLGRVDGQRAGLGGGGQRAGRACRHSLSRFINRLARHSSLISLARLTWAAPASPLLVQRGREVYGPERGLLCRQGGWRGADRGPLKWRLELWGQGMGWEGRGGGRAAAEWRRAGRNRGVGARRTSAQHVAMALLMSLPYTGTYFFASAPRARHCAAQRQPRRRGRGERRTRVRVEGRPALRMETDAEKAGKGLRADKAQPAACTWQRWRSWVDSRERRDSNVETAAPVARMEECGALRCVHREACGTASLGLGALRVRLIREASALRPCASARWQSAPHSCAQVQLPRATDREEHCLGRCMPAKACNGQVRGRGHGGSRQAGSSLLAR